MTVPLPSALTPWSGESPQPDKGTLIALEGNDGAGKSTASSALARALRARGADVIVSKWNSSPVVHPALEKGKDERVLTPLGFSLLYAADFADRLDRVIMPALDAGKTVICERYACTALVRDGARGLDEEWIRTVYSMAPRPHLTLFLRIDPPVALERILADRGETSFYEAGQDITGLKSPEQSFLKFQADLLQRYEALVDEMGMTVIDADQPPRAVQQQVIDLATSALATA